MGLGAVTSEITRNLWISKGKARIASNCDRDYVTCIMARHPMLSRRSPTKPTPTP
ncbi:hypothetical protein SAMN03159463_05125 [Mesorhizobium sp. NFR06]|nr:hypothetical protein SAMN03159463_05125 [Mesorhizobium sp. NFR06]